MDTELIYEPVEFGYYCSVFKLVEIHGYKPVKPEIGEKSTLNWMLNAVANGCTLTIRPKPATEPAKPLDREGE